VSSKLSNSQNRRIIRSTWKNTLPSSVLFKFVLSETSCNIDPLWRLNQDGCEHWDLVIPKWMRDGSPIVYFSVANSVEAHKSYPGIYFKVKTFPILVHKIGLLSEVLRNLRSNYSISLILEDSRTGQTIQNISFSTADKIGAEYTMKECVGRVGGVPGGLDGGGLEIPPNFQGLLYFQSTDTGLFDIKCSVKPENQLGKHGIIILTGLLVGGGGRSRVPYSGFSCPLINLEYSLPEPTDVRQHLSARETQNTVEERRNKETEKDLNVEIEDNDDMIFLPTTDTPSSIPRNTKMFLSYLSSSVSFDYVLLTTDDALLNIDTILSGLDDLSSWWSSFVLFSAVEEPDIKLQAASFPPRPRAKSSVISNQLADFVARNSEILEDFSSLSRSLAVWFAGLNPRLLDDDRWVAVGEEAENGLGEAEITRRWKQGKVVVLEGLSAQQMESVWKD